MTKTVDWGAEVKAKKLLRDDRNLLWELKEDRTFSLNQSYLQYFLKVHYVIFPISQRELFEDLIGLG